MSNVFGTSYDRKDKEVVTMKKLFYKQVKKESARKGHNKAVVQWLEGLGWNTETLKCVSGTKLRPRVACATVNRPSLLLRAMTGILSLFE